MLFIPAYRLVQDMLAAKRDLELPRMLRKLDNFDLLVIDDLGYLPQGAGESEVLFTLIAERYERRSLGITSNLVFSEWEKVFANPMAPAAAIDRIVHHSVILEFDLPSYRTNAAQSWQSEKLTRRQESLLRINCGPPDVRYYRTLGITQSKLGLTKEAMESVETAFQMDPEDQGLVLDVVAAASMMGDKRKFRRYSKIARHLGAGEELISHLDWMMRERGRRELNRSPSTRQWVNRR